RACGCRCSRPRLVPASGLRCAAPAARSRISSGRSFAGRFADSSIKALINRSPASRLAAGDCLHDYARLPAPLGPVGRREFEIKDADPFDKHIRTAPCAQRASVALIRRPWSGAEKADEIKLSATSSAEASAARTARKGNKSPGVPPKVPEKLPDCLQLVHGLEVGRG